MTKINNDLLPNAYIIGVQKAGTTSLHYWLSQHPEVYGPNELKDRDILTHPTHSKQIEASFSRLLRDWRSEKVILHSQVNYVFYSEALYKIAELTPDAKLILVLRNPVERAISAYNYFRSLEKEDRPIQQALMYEPHSVIKYSEESSNKTYLEHGYYYKQIKQVYDLFNKDQLLILEFEELKLFPQQVLNKVFEFLGISYFKPNMTPKNITGAAKSRTLQKLLAHTSPNQQKIMKNFINPWFSVEKRNNIKKWIRKKNTKTDSKTTNREPIPSVVVEFLNRHFVSEMKSLDRLLETDYFNRWIK